MSIRNLQSGITFIEIAFALLILGFVFAGTGRIYTVIQNQRAETITQARMDTVLDALSSYVQTHGRLPCPADPARGDQIYGWEFGVTDSTIAANPTKPIGTCDDVSTSASNDTIGVVPFQTLLLSPETHLDGWGRPFTYAISPVFTQNNDVTGTGQPRDLGNVHAKCRREGWVLAGDTQNGPKARFCCMVNGNTSSYAPASTDLAIEFLDGTDISPPQRDTGNYSDMNVEATAPYGGSIVTPALVLLSHGPNGYGAFAANNSRDRTPTSNADTSEVENADFDRIFRTGPRGGQFDDIVIWRTQNGIMAENGTSSCHAP